MNKNLVINWYETLDSTNSEAARQLEGAAEGTVWTTDFQTKGKGQRGNTWESARGKNLMFTLLLRPDFLPASRQFLVSQAAALGVCRYLKDKGLNAKIKWPNDIYVGDKKICGMLLEHTLGGDKLSASIAGIGINLNQTRFESDAPNPTSVLLEAPGEELDRKEELLKVLTCIFTLYESLRGAFSSPFPAGGAGQECGTRTEEDSSAVRCIEEEYLESLYRRNEWHRFTETATGTVITARITGVNENACLVLEQAGGLKKAYAFKEIRYIL